MWAPIFFFFECSDPCWRLALHGPWFSSQSSNQMSQIPRSSISRSHALIKLILKIVTHCFTVYSELLPPEKSGVLRGAPTCQHDLWTRCTPADTLSTPMQPAPSQKKRNLPRNPSDATDGRRFLHIHGSQPLLLLLQSYPRSLSDCRHSFACFQPRIESALMGFGSLSCKERTSTHVPFHPQSA